MWCHHAMQSLNLGFMHTLCDYITPWTMNLLLSQDLCTAIYSCDKAQMLLMLQILGMIYTAGTQLGPSFLSCCCCSWPHTWKPMLQTAPNVTLFLNQAIQCDHAQMLTHVAEFWNDTAVFVHPDSSKIQLIKLQMSLMLQIFKRMLLQGSSTFAPPFLCFCCCRGSHTWKPWVLQPSIRPLCFFLKQWSMEIFVVQNLLWVGCCIRLHQTDRFFKLELWNCPKP